MKSALDLIFHTFSLICGFHSNFLFDTLWPNNLACVSCSVWYESDAPRTCPCIIYIFVHEQAWCFGTGRVHELAASAGQARGKSHTETSWCVSTEKHTQKSKQKYQPGQVSNMHFPSMSCRAFRSPPPPLWNELWSTMGLSELTRCHWEHFCILVISLLPWISKLSKQLTGGYRWLRHVGLSPWSL